MATITSGLVATAKYIQLPTASLNGNLVFSVPSVACSGVGVISTGVVTG